MNEHKCAVSLKNHPTAAADFFRLISATEYLANGIQKGEVQLIAVTLHLVRAKILNWNTTKIHKL